MPHHRSLLNLGLIAVAIFTTVPASANVLPNGDFEATPFDKNWDNRSTVAVATSGLDGSGTAAYIQSSVSDLFLQQGLDDLSPNSGPQWRVSVQFATTDPGGSNARAFNMQIRFPEETNAGGQPTINMRLVRSTDPTRGELEVYNNVGSAAAWVPIFTNAVSFSSDVNNNKDFTDAGDTLAVYTLTLQGDSTSHTYTVFLAGPGIAGTLSSGVLTNFQYRYPYADQGSISTILFDGSAAKSDFVVDNIDVSAVPEPASAALVTLGLGAMLSRRRGSSNGVRP